MNPKSLVRNGSRQNVAVQYNKVVYAGQSAAELRQMQKRLYRRALRLSEPVERIVTERTPEGLVERVVLINDDKALCDVSRTYVAICEQRRIVLRVPAPGRDGPLESKTIDMQPADIVDAVPAQPGPASEPSQAEPAQGS